MIRFNIVRNLLVALALVTGGCAAQSTSSNDLDQSENPLGHTELVAIGANGSSSIAPNTERSGGPAPNGDEANGPQPEPWTGIDDPNGNPQPEPWHPKKPEPEPSSAQPSSTPPKP